MTFLSSYPVISSINKLSKHKAAKSMSTFDFSTLYAKIRHEKPLYGLYEVTDFTFIGGTIDYVTVYNLIVFWSWFKSKTGRPYLLQEAKSCLEFLITNSFF